MLSVNILEMYTKSFESLIKLPKLSSKKRKAAAAKSSVIKENKMVNKKPRINYFAGPTSVLVPTSETAV